MKLKQFVFLWICLAALLTGCENHDEPEVTYGNRTVLVYMAADNSLADFALADLEEMKAGMAKVYDKGVHLLVYIDYAHKSEGKQPRLIELKNENGKVIEEVVKTYADRNSVGVSETQEVFADAFSNSKYRAESYGLIYWSHGDGWIPYPLRAETRWVGQDEGDGDNRMNISELVEILKEAPHLDFLFVRCLLHAVGGGGVCVARLYGLLHCFSHRDSGAGRHVRCACTGSVLGRQRGCECGECLL